MADSAMPLGAADLDWVHASIARLEREAARSADTHLLQATFPGYPGIDFYFKDEAAHPTGSLKHRLARSLFLYALCNGRLRAGQLVIDASTGSTAISEAWFARLLGLRFVAVVPQSTEPGKLKRIRALAANAMPIRSTIPAGSASMYRNWMTGAMGSPMHLRREAHRPRGTASVSAERLSG